jgi:hypothetical protein
MFYRHFSPRKLDLPFVQDDQEQLESSFQDLRGVESTINKWLSATGSFSSTQAAKSVVI